MLHQFGLYSNIPEAVTLIASLSGSMQPFTFTLITPQLYIEKSGILFKGMGILAKHSIT